MTHSFSDGFDQYGGDPKADSIWTAPIPCGEPFFVSSETTEIHTERYSVVYDRVEPNKWVVTYSPVGAPTIRFETSQRPHFTLTD